MSPSSLLLLNFMFASSRQICTSRCLGSTQIQQCFVKPQLQMLMKIPIIDYYYDVNFLSIFFVLYSFIYICICSPWPQVYGQKYTSPHQKGFENICSPRTFLHKFHLVSEERICKVGKLHHQLPQGKNPVTFTTSNECIIHHWGCRLLKNKDLTHL